MSFVRYPPCFSVSVASKGVRKSGSRAAALQILALIVADSSQPAARGLDLLGRLASPSYISRAERSEVTESLPKPDRKAEIAGPEKGNSGRVAAALDDS
jgi:hypothetical protein